MRRNVKIVWSPSALDQFADWIRYIARDSVRAAKKEQSRILSAVKKLRRFPFIGRIVPEFDEPELREIIKPPIRILYRLRNNEVHVMTLHHERREMNRELFD